MQEHESIANLRKVYKMQSLREADVKSDAMDQFEIWWKHAIEAQIDEPNAMILSTCSREGFPSSRVVLLKGLLPEGFIFFTNYNSRKGVEIKQNPAVSLLFFWKEMERQIRIEGIAEKISREQSEKYFESRPRESQVGAWSSPQSQTIPGREYLQEKEKLFSEEYRSRSIPVPPFWGGYLIKPKKMEFWQGRPSRLHDRLLYSLYDNRWKIERLAP